MILSRPAIRPGPDPTAILGAMAEKKPRILQDSRDMVWSLIPLLLICVVIAGIAGSCSWGFGNEAAKQAIPSFDSRNAFRADARTLPFPIREPALPGDWQSNSGFTSVVGGSQTSNVGWITPSGTYVQLTQTTAPEAELVPEIGGAGVAGTGTVDAGGQTWVTYANEDEGRQVWITDLGDVRIGLLGRGQNPPLDVLATATLKAQPLPK
ncbi:hypothetical protein GOHSU_57_00020 [Gordonia hirsuta DSM 44140 = NBRC 16056]|uniref:DUF4245 domain-containing protein n=2 Tax=Gordonia hirsuta TaxID=53427 RepID=L7LCM6_9ACTN|nr:hypothetical protein GOHSU_57_00020 [Gordonia hirsuta DSM 44140 = NBRC 16056]